PCSLLCALSMLATTGFSQSAVRVEPPKGGLGWLTRPYQKTYIPSANLNNSSRLASLIRAGHLYLTAQDVIALALENNLDIEIQRYGPLLAEENTKRAEGGGPLRSGVGVPVAAGPQSVSLTGVNLTAATAVSSTSTTSSGVLTYIGPTIPSFDPQLSFYADFGHRTVPQSNTFLTGTTALITDSRTYQAQYSQNFDWGMMAQLSYTSQHLSVNSPNSFLDPYNSGGLELYITQSLLNGFGRAVNDREINIGKNQQKVAMLQFKQQVITTVSAVLNLYWDLVSFEENVRAKKDELKTAQQLYNDNKRQVQIGTMAPIEVTRAEAQVYTAQQDLLVAQTNLSQQEVVLKNALSKNGIMSPLLKNVEIVPLDQFSIPKETHMKPLNELVDEALARRVEIAQDKINLDSLKINLKGVKSGLRPSLQAFVDLTNNALSGASNPANAATGISADPFLVGGYGNFLGQIFRRNYPNYSAGFSLSIPLRNRAAQADYALSVLQLRQTQLQLQAAVNQVRVGVSNAVVGVQQARAQYDAAVKARILQQQTLNADKKRFNLGAGTVFQVVQDQQTLAAAQTSEIEALANYTHAQIAFQQAIGTTLEVNHVSMHDALTGHVSRPSVLPAVLPKEAQ
ncbi:MAG: TolC family protein, partial [Bryobacteraceae bacterium]